MKAGKVFLLNLFILNILYLYCIANAETKLDKEIIQNTTWTLKGSPYVANQNIVVKEGVTLTIEPGVTVIFNNESMLIVDGKLIAQGTDLKHIVFVNTAKEVTKGGENIKFTSKSMDAKYDENGKFVDGCVLENCYFKFEKIDETAVKTEPIIIENIDAASPFVHLCYIEAKNKMQPKPKLISKRKIRCCRRYTVPIPGDGYTEALSCSTFEGAKCPDGYFPG